MFFIHSGKKYSKELNHIEKFYVSNTFKFLKNNNIAKLCDDYATVFSSEISLNIDSITRDFIVKNSKIVNRDLINLDVVNLYENIDNIYEKSKKYDSKLKNQIDYIIYKYKNYFIITNSVNHKVKYTFLSKINDFEKELLKANNKWEKIEKNFPLFDYSAVNTLDLLRNISVVIDCYSLYDINAVKFILDLVNRDKGCLFLYIVDNENNISITFKTIKNRSSASQFILSTNFNLKRRDYVTNNLNSVFTGLIYDSASQYFQSFRGTEYNQISYFTLKSKMELKSINYANLIDEYCRFFLSENMLDDSLDDIDFFMIKGSPIRFNFNIDFYNLSKKEYEPFKINFEYLKSINKILLDYVSFNDFNKKNPAMTSNNKGPSYIKVHKKFSTIKYSTSYSVYYLNRKNNISKKYFNSYKDLPLFKKNEKELTKILLKYDDSFTSYYETFLWKKVDILKNNFKNYVERRINHVVIRWYRLFNLGLWAI